MDGETALLKMAKSGYVNPAQLLHDSMYPRLPYSLRPIPTAAQNRNVRSFMNVLAEEEKQHEPHTVVPARKHQDLMNIYAYYVELSAP